MLLLVFLGLSYACPLNSEDDLLKQISQKTFEINSVCIQSAIEKAWYDAALLMVTISFDQEMPLEPSLKISAQAAKRKLEKLITSLDNTSTIQVVSPAYQWAQSPDIVYLDIKFSHRLDSPGCLEIMNPEVSITETRLTFSGHCARSTQRIKLDLDLEFFTEINAEESSYSFTSVGRLNVNIKKKESISWPKPMKGKKPNNVHTWWEMKEKYQKAMNKLTGEDDDTNEPAKKSPEGLMNSEKKDL